MYYSETMNIIANINRAAIPIRNVTNVANDFSKIKTTSKHKDDLI